MISNSHQTEKKRENLINLKTNLPDVEINPKLYKVKRLSVSELINQPAIVKKKIFDSIICWGNAKRIFEYIINDTWERFK